MIWKFRKQNGLFPKGLNWVQHWVSRIGLFVTYEKSQYFYAKGFFKGVQRTLWSSIFLTLKIDVLQTRLYGHLLNIRTPHSYKSPHFSKEKSVHFPSLPVYSCLKLKLTYNAIVNRKPCLKPDETGCMNDYWTFDFERSIMFDFRTDSKSIERLELDYWSFDWLREVCVSHHFNNNTLHFKLTIIN